MSAAAGGGERAQPFYCPYCGETDLRPGEDHGTWRCEICERPFALSYRGLETGAGAVHAGAGGERAQ